MRIAFDAQLLFEKQKTGIGWNSKMLIDEMIKDKSNEYQLNCFNFRRSEEKERIIQEYREKGCIIKECRWIPASVYNHLERIVPFPYKWLFGTDADITQFFNYTVPFGVGTKCATFVHDMAYKAYPETVAKKTLDWLNGHMKSYCQRATQIITVSEFSKTEIIKYLSVPSKKISVIYNGVDLDLYNSNYTDMGVGSVKQKYGIDRKYILYLGTLEPRKNIEGLLNAYMLLKKEIRQIPKLVIAGKKGWLYDSIFKIVEEYDLLHDVIFTGYVHEEDIPLLMNGAALFIYPSLYEGFGIPPLEAMACGIPVIASNTSSLPEVVGDAGITVNPFEPSSLKDAMKRLLLDKDLVSLFHSKGPKRAMGFTWKKSAAKLIDIYREMDRMDTDADT